MAHWPYPEDTGLSGSDLLKMKREQDEQLQKETREWIKEHPEATTRQGLAVVFVVFYFFFSLCFFIWLTTTLSWLFDNLSIISPILHLLIIALLIYVGWIIYKKINPD